MAFNLKKRFSARVDDSTNGDSESTDVETTPSTQAKPVVATQSWVYNVMNGIYNWTRGFQTQFLRVLGPIETQTVHTNAVLTQDLLSSHITLVDPNGRPASIFIGNDGKLHVEYDFKSVFAYPGDDVLDVRQYFYRTPDVMANFIGLTPYETLLNFLPFQNAETATFNNKTCYKVCAADSEDALVGPTLLFTCGSMNKIKRLKVIDSLGRELKEFTLPNERPVHKLTVNMPSFRTNACCGHHKTLHVGLPSERCVCQSCETFTPFMSPFAPPPMPGPCPGKPVLPADIFNDPKSTFVPDPSTETTDIQDLPGPVKYDVVYENYVTDTYSNITLKRSDFVPNQEQFLVAVVE